MTLDLSLIKFYHNEMSLPVSPHYLRLHAFDTLRFAAALVVILAHCNMIYPMSLGIPFFMEGFFDPQIAVAFFFVLSGCVLHLSMRNRPLNVGNYTAFMVKRIFRLYPLYYVALAFCALVVFVLPLADLRILASNDYTGPILNSDHHDVFQWLAQLTMISPKLDNGFVNPPMWTLSAEMRISILFPFLSFFIASRGWRSTIFFTTVLFFSCPVLGHLLFPTLGLLPLFSLGIVVGHLISDSRPSRWPAAVFLILGALLYSSAPALPNLLRSVLGEEAALLAKLYVSGIGAGCFMVAVHRNNWLSTVLSNKTLVYLGKCSYGIYIFHTPVLLAAVNFLDKRILRTPVFFSAVTMMSLLIAMVFYHTVELPFIQMGRKLVNVIFPKPASVASLS